MAQRLSESDVSPAIARKIAARASGADEAIVVGTRAGVIEWANAAWTKVTGYAVDDAIDKPIGWLLEAAEIEPPVVDFVQRHFLGGRRCEVEFPVDTPDGRHLWIHLDVEPFRDEQGEISDFVAVATDITVRRQGELALEDRISRALAETALDAEHGEPLPDAGARSGVHAADASDLESLVALARIAEGVDLSLRRYSDTRPEDTLRRIRQIARERLAAFATGRDDAAPAPRLVDLAEELTAACRHVEGELPVTLALDVELAEGLPGAMLDPHALRSLVEDLLRDATFAIGSEWGTVSVTTGLAEPGRALASTVHPTTDRFPLQASRAHVFIEIHDTAPSLSREALAYVHDGRGPVPTDARTLGLALAGRRVASLGGELRVHSLPGIGTRVVVYLPVPAFA